MHSILKAQVDSLLVKDIYTYDYREEMWNEKLAAK
jgi:hypothetical protein